MWLLSGAFRPGLIEAAIFGSYAETAPLLSGAFRPGLIEASALGPRHWPSPDYPGHFAPASLKRADEELSDLFHVIIRGISPRPH